MVMTPNHKRLVNACYPKPLALEACAPDSNAIGRLTYYCSQRPEKLPKASEYVVSYAKYHAHSHQLGKKNAGLCCTVDVMTAILNACPAHLSTFGLHVLAVVDYALGRTDQGTWHGDLTMAEKAATLFVAFSTYATGALIGVDDALTDAYLKTLTHFADLAVGQLKVDELDIGVNLRIIALAALEGTILCEALYTSQFQKQIDLIVPSLVHNLLPISSFPSLPKIRDVVKDLDGTVPKQHAIKVPVHERRARTIQLETLHLGDADTITSEFHIRNSAIRALHTLFRLCNAEQVAVTLTKLLDHTDVLEEGRVWKDLPWCRWMASLVIDAVHLLYRPAVIATLTAALQTCVIADKPLSKATGIAIMITEILAGSTPIVGLGIGTVLNDLLAVVSRLSESTKCTDLIIEVIINAIGSLAAHIYYADQVEDICRDLIAEAINVSQGRLTNFREEGGVVMRDNVLYIIAHCLCKVLKFAHEGSGIVSHATPLHYNEKTTPSSTHADRDQLGRPLMKIEDIGKRNAVRVSTWRDSLFLLNESHLETRIAYANALLRFLGDELPFKGRDDVNVEEVDGSNLYGNPTSRFLHSFCASVHDLAVSKSIGGTDSQASSRPASRKGRLSKATNSTSTLSNDISDSLATPSDYAIVRDCLAILTRQQGGEIAVVVIPMLIALDHDAGTRWVSTSFSSNSDDVARRRACREISTSTIKILAQVWQSTQLLKACDEISNVFKPSVIPEPSEVAATLVARNGKSNKFPVATSMSSSPILDRNFVIEHFSQSKLLQQQTRMDQDFLKTELAVEWTYEKSILLGVGRNVNESKRTSTFSLSPKIAGLTGRPRPRSSKSLTSTSVHDLKLSLTDSENGHAKNTGGGSSRTPSLKVVCPDGKSISSSRVIKSNKERKVTGGSTEILNQLRIASEKKQTFLPVSSAVLITPPYDF